METNADELLALAKSVGDDDPVVECDEHGVRLRYSELSDFARLALHAGLDSKNCCLLKR